MSTQQATGVTTIEYGGAPHAIETGQITGTRLGFGGFGIMTANVTMSFPGEGQGYGGYNLTRPDLLDGAVRAILAVAGVSTWEELKGRPVRAVHQRTDTYSPIVALLHATNDSIVLDLEAQAKAARS